MEHVFLIMLKYLLDPSNGDTVATAAGSLNTSSVRVRPWALGSVQTSVSAKLDFSQNGKKSMVTKSLEMELKIFMDLLFQA